MIETIIYFTSKTLYSERTKYYNSGLALYGKPHASDCIARERECFSIDKGSEEGYSILRVLDFLLSE